MKTVNNKGKKQQNKKEEKRKIKRTEKLIFGIGITALIFVVATYAWFIGLTEVHVNEFEIDVKSSEGLTISLDAVTFGTEVNVSKDEVTTNLLETYPGHTNAWVGDDGLLPSSSVGVMDPTTSRLELYSKASMVAVNGGYRLRSAKIDNSVNETGDYVVFDLFIKNTSGSGYSAPFAEGDDEGVYLTKDSIVTLSSTGEGGDGIENSLRIGFMQIGRVYYKAGNTGAEGSVPIAQNITCASEDESVDELKRITGLCNQGTNNGQGYTWNIWEPNDLSHTAEAKNHILKTCKKRTAIDTYEGKCLADEDGASTITSTTYIDTYAVNDVIETADKVNIYDGINEYPTESISEKLTKMDYFTDTELAEVGGQELFYLAPNSITKVRVYVWLEGQDIDNFDLESFGKKIIVSFGFTKDKYSELEVDPGEIPHEEP